MQSGCDSCMGGHSGRERHEQGWTWRAAHSLGHARGREKRCHIKKGRTTAAVPSDWAQSWAEENLQHQAESHSVPESKARALQGIRESLVHGVEVNCPGT